MSELTFPSRSWCQAAARALAADPGVRAALADFGPVVAGVVIEKGDGLAEEFCVLARLAPGREPELEFPQDEDELESLEPDYIAWASHSLCRAMLGEALGGGNPDPLQAILTQKIRLRGDLQRLVRQAGKHQGVGLAPLRALPTRFLPGR